MPTLEYKTIVAPIGTHAFCSAVIFHSLLARFNENDIERFTSFFEELFAGQGMLLKFGRLQVDFNTYKSSGVFPASLSESVKQNFLPKLAAHLRQRTQEFSQEFLSAHIEASAQEVLEGNIGVIAQRALAHMLNVRIQVYTKSAQCLSLSETIGEGTVTVSILQETTSYHPLMKPEQLNAEQRMALNSLLPLVFESTPNGMNTAASFTEEAIGVLVKQTIAALPEQLKAISVTIPEEPAFFPLSATNEPSLVRIEYHEPHLPLRDLMNVSLEETALTASYQDVVVFLKDAKVESTFTWAGSMVKTCISGALGGAFGLGLSAGVAEAVVAITGGVLGTGAAAVSTACLPVFITCTLLTLIGGVVGKSYAKTYKEVLQQVTWYIRNKKYTEAIAALDAEFNRSFIVGSLRRPFLTKAHYAVAHFFRGMCAEMQNNNNDNFAKAYTEYRQALDDAKSTDAKIIVLLLHLKLLQLLHQHGRILVPREAELQALIKSHLQELNVNFNQGLTHLYWQARKNMVSIAAICYLAVPPTKELIAEIKGVLSIQSLFALEEYNEGRGKHIQVFYGFFKALVTAYFNSQHPQKLMDIGIVARDENDVLLRILNTLIDTFSQYNTFKTAYPDVANSPEFQSCYVMMHNFALQFGGLVLAKNTLGPNIRNYQLPLANLAVLLSTNIQKFHDIAWQRESEIAFLLQIEEEFGLHFISVNEWLNALCDKRQNTFRAVSTRTHNNMLHKLVQLPAELAKATLVEEAAARMKDFIYARNNEQHTPLSLLAIPGIDVYAIKPTIIPPKIMALNNELAEVSAFIKSVEQNVDVEGHFLLLQGPPGTGKTETVMTHLRSQDYTVFNWVGGTAEDCYVNQVENRIVSFFGKAVALSQKSSSNKAIILFIDEISGVCYESGKAQNGCHNHETSVNEFQKETSKLKGHNVVLIGATNYPERLSKAMQDRMTRVIFSNPGHDARKRLLNHLMREKIIAEELIVRVVNLTQGWSPRQLVRMVESIKEVVVSANGLGEVFAKSRELAQEDFRKEFKAAHLGLPQFTEPEPSSMVIPAAITGAFTELMQSLIHRELYENSIMHTLLYGPPGSGKTTAIREFAKSNNCPFILIESGTTVQDFMIIFERAKLYTAAIICIDEVDNVAHDASDLNIFLQEQMNGVMQNNIAIVGATNYPERIVRPILRCCRHEIPAHSTMHLI